MKQDDLCLKRLAWSGLRHFWSGHKCCSGLSGRWSRAV